MTRTIKYLFLWPAICLCHLTTLAQNKNIDSLLTLIKIDKPDTINVIHLNILSREYVNIGLFNNALNFSNQALQLAAKLNFKKGISTAYSNFGLVYYYQTNYPKTVDYWIKALRVDEDLKDKSGIANRLGNIGLVFTYQGYYPKALDYFFNSLKLNEELKNKNGIGTNLGNIGLVYTYQGDYVKALNYYFKALKLSRDLKDKNRIATQLGNIGGIYNLQADYAKALDYYFQGLKMDNELGDTDGMARQLGNIGIVFAEQNDSPKALDYFSKYLKLAKELGNKNYQAIALSNIGSLYTKTGKFKEAELSLKKAIALDDSIGALNDSKHLEESISQLYEKTGRQKEALIHYKKAIALKDTIFSQENKKQLVQKEMSYEFDKKEIATKAEQDKRDSIAAEEKQKQKVITYSVSIGLFLVALLAIFIFRGLKQKQKANKIITKQKEIVEEKNKLVEEKQKEILDSIHYAKRIQRALLTSEGYLNKNLPEYFVLFKPKDIVSGDFYWALQQNGCFLILIGDCTGHGVPGAFMSLLNISFLNEVTLERKTVRPDLVLNDVREEIINTLNPEGTETEGKDGMDCILCSFDFNKNTLEAACANNPLWIIRNQEVIEYKPDKMPVGKHSGEEKDFTLQKIELQKGDTVYAFTDGYADQFGGSKGKKFKYKQLNEKLIAINHLSLAEQKKELEKVFDDWKGNLEQVDDVLIMGIKI